MNAFRYGPEQVIAKNEREARRILRENLGESRIVGLTRSRPPLIEEVEEVRSTSMAEEDGTRV